MVVFRATDNVVMGRTETGIVGGAEFMSNLPVLLTKRAGRILLHGAGSKTLGGRITSFHAIGEITTQGRQALLRYLQVANGTIGS